MNDQLKKLLKQIKKDEDGTLLSAAENLHKRINISAQISKDIFGEIDPKVVFEMYDCLVKEQAIVVWSKVYKAKNKNDNSPSTTEYPYPWPITSGKNFN